MRTMDVQTLRWFTALCETENTRDAAAELGTGQSAVSRALTRLEADLGVPLFHRIGRRLQLNRFGVLYLEHVRRALQELDAGRLRLESLGGPDTGLVRLGFLHSTGRWLVPELIGDYRRVAPASRFELGQAFSGELYRRLDAGTLDVAIVTPPPEGQASQWVSLRDERLCLALPAEHRLARRAGVSLTDLDGEPFIAFSAATDLRGVIAELLAEVGVVPHIVVETAEIATMRGLIAAGLGLGVMPVPHVPEDHEPAYRPMRPSRVRRLGLAWNPAALEVGSVAAFVTHLVARRPQGRPRTSGVTNDGGRPHP